MKREKGSGSVVKKGDKFYARWRINGSEMYGPARSSQDDAEIDRIKNRPNSSVEHISNRNMPTLVQFSRMCMNESDPTFGYYARGLMDATYNMNATHLEVHLAASKLGSKKLNEIKSTEVEEWVRDIRSKKWIKRDGVMTSVREPASPAYKRRCHAFVRKIFNIAIKHQIIGFNPAAGVDLPHVPTRRNVLLTDAQLRLLYQCTCRTGSLLILAAESGLRRGELIAIRWEHLNEDGLVVVNHKNRDQEDMVPLSSISRSAIDRQPKNGDWVFSTAEGKPLSARNLNKDVRTLFDKLGFPKGARLHDLRGKFTSDLISAGVDIKTTQALARHKDASTTLKYYARTTEAAQVEGLKALSKKRGIDQQGSGSGE